MGLRRSCFYTIIQLENWRIPGLRLTSYSTLTPVSYVHTCGKRQHVVRPQACLLVGLWFKNGGKETFARKSLFLCRWLENIFARLGKGGNVVESWLSQSRYDDASNRIAVWMKLKHTHIHKLVCSITEEQLEGTSTGAVGAFQLWLCVLGPFYGCRFLLVSAFRFHVSCCSCI